MKKLLGLLAAAVLLPVAANADVLKNVNLIGEIQTIGTDVNHANDKIGFPIYARGAATRAIAGLSTDLVEDVTANVLFQYAYHWGDNNEGGYGFSNDDGMGGKVVTANVVLHNLFCCLEATVGRQFYGDENSAVMYIGPKHYNAETLGYAQALDAVKIAYTDDFKSFTAIAGRMTFNAFVPTDPYTVYGVDFKIKPLDTLTAQVYGYDFRNTGDDQDAGFYGAKVGFTPEETLRFSVEYARNFAGERLVKEHSKDHGGQGHMFKADAAVDVDMATVRGTFYYANENFVAFGNYTPGLLIGHHLAGTGETINEYSWWDGVAVFNLGVDVKPAEKWTISLDGFSFQDRRLKHNATLEADLTATYDHNENVQLFAGIGYAKYSSNEDVSINKDEFRADNYKTQLGMLIKF